MDNKCIVVFSLPCWFEADDLQTIISSINPQEISYNWNINLKNQSKLKLCLLSHRVAINEKFNTQNLMVFCEINEQAKAKAENMINYYENSKDKKPPSVIPYMKRKDVRLRLEKLMMEWQNDMKFLSLNFPDNILHLENLSPVDISGQILIKISGSSQIQVSPKCFVILPIGIPGMGKSSLIPYLEQFCSQNEYILTVISPDTIRKSENLSEHFDFSNKETRKCLFNQLKTAITSNNNRQMIYIDKNHSPNSLEMMMNRIKRFSFVKIIGMWPYSNQPWTIQVNKQEYHYELSLSFLIQCLLRIRDRENHETLTGNLAHKLSIVLMNYNFYNNFSFDGIQSLDYGIVIPFTDENYSEIDENLENLIKHILLSINTQTNPNISIYQDLAAYILHFSYDFLHVDASDQLEAQLLYIINNN